MRPGRQPNEERPRRDLANFFIHCVGVRFFLELDWDVVRKAIWSFARRTALEDYISVMRRRSCGMFFTKRSIEKVFQRGGFTYISFTPGKTGTYLVIKGFEDWFGMVRRLVALLELDVVPRCEGATCLEVAAMVREDPLLRAMLRGHQPKLRRRRLSLLMRAPEERRRGRRKIFVELEIYRLGDPLRPEADDDPPGIVKIEVRSKVKRAGMFTDHLSTDFANRNHFETLLAALTDHLLETVERHGLTVVPRTRHRAGLAIPKDCCIFKAPCLAGAGARPTAMTDEAYLRRIADQRRDERQASSFVLMDDESPSVSPVVPPGDATSRAASHQAPARPRSREVFLTRKPSKLDRGWNRIRPGMHDVQIQDSFVRALVFPNDHVELQLGLRLWVADGEQAGLVFPVLLHAGQWARLRELLAALGEQTPGGVEPADLRRDWLVGRALGIRIERRGRRPTLGGFIRSGGSERAKPRGPLFGTVEQRARLKTRALTLARDVASHGISGRRPPDAIGDEKKAPQPLSITEPRRTSRTER